MGVKNLWESTLSAPYSLECCILFNLSIYAGTAFIAVYQLHSSGGGAFIPAIGFHLNTSGLFTLIVSSIVGHLIVHPSYIRP